MKLDIVLFLAVVGTVSANRDFLRDLQGGNSALPPPPPQNGTRPPPPLPTFYDENITIPFTASLGCGGCIRGGYVFCLPGPFGSNST